MELHTHTFLQGGKYRIEKVLGQGGFGITYLGTQVALNRKVAIKEFFMKEYCNRDEATSRVSVPSEGSKELVAKFKTKFIKEAQTIAEMDNQHIIRIHDVFEENGTAYYVMEYLQGGDLSHKISSKGIPETEALEYIRQVGEALSYIHAKNILHLDIKPTNILFRENGDVVLIDFGVSKHYDDTSGSQTSSTPVGISEGYAPTEQYDREAIASFAPSTDVYSLGATLYCLLCGTRPPKASVVLNEGLPGLPSKVSESTRKAVEKAMAPRRKDRPQSVKEFLALLDDEVTIVEPKTEPKKTPKATVTSTSNPFKKWIVNLKHFFSSPNPKSTTKKWKLFLIYFLIFSLVFGLRDYYTYITTKDFPSVNFLIEPNGAKVYVDDQYIGTSPIFNEKIPRGNHSIKICKEGYETISENVNFEDKDIDIWKTLLPRGKQTIEIKTDSPGNAIDLGLSVKWADRNIGASSPSEYGDYFAWGEILPKKVYVEANYINHNKKLEDISGNSYYDAACANWKNNWRLPTKTECKELISKCTWEKDEQNGKKGYKVIGPNGNSIFLPFTGQSKEYFGLTDVSTDGYYWSSTPDEKNKAHALWLFGSNMIISNSYFYYGKCIRPVSD